MRRFTTRHLVVAVVLGALVALAGGYAALVVVMGVGYMLTPEGVCMEDERPIWEPATGSAKCQAKDAPTPRGRRSCASAPTDMCP